MASGSMEEVIFSILFDIRFLFPGSVLLMNQHFMEVFVSVAYFVRLWVEKSGIVLW